MVAVAESMSGEQVRALCRTSAFTEPTSGAARGYVQCNIVILPADIATSFEDFCRLNPKPCPLLAISPTPGDPGLPALGTNIDIRYDIPRYRIWQKGALVEHRLNIAELWHDDFVTFALGCSFSFEEALLNAGIEVRNVSEGVNVPMFRTNLDCTPAGIFRGKMVVSMRPMPPAQAIEAIQICSRYPSVHGAPIHFGDAGQLGIEDLSQPDFGDPVSINEDDVPVFWACGVTPQVALENAQPALAITHEPGHMLVTDLKNVDLAEDR